MALGGRSGSARTMVYAALGAESYVPTSRATARLLPRKHGAGGCIACARKDAIRHPTGTYHLTRHQISAGAAAGEIQSRLWRYMLRNRKMIPVWAVGLRKIATAWAVGLRVLTLGAGKTGSAPWPADVPCPKAVLGSIGGGSKLRQRRTPAPEWSGATRPICS